MISKKSGITKKKILFRIFGYPVLAYCILSIYALLFSESMIFQPQPSSYQDNLKILKIKVNSKRNISAIFKEHPDAKFTILYSHGNAEDIGDIEPVLDLFVKVGFSAIAYDYAGYGTSEGTPSEQGCYDEVNAIYNYLTKTRAMPPEKIIVYGRSVGGGPSVELASKKKVGGLILESAFATAFTVVTEIPVLPFDKFENIKKIQTVRNPVFIIHGTADRVVPFSHGEAMFRKANEPKIFLPFEGKGHNDPFPMEKRFQEKIKKFVELINYSPIS